MKTDGLAAIFWNSRRLIGTPFLEGYEALLKRHGTDYTSVAERYADDDSMRAWFGAGWRGTTRFEYKQLLDYDGLRGRLMSSSYVPKPGHAQHAPMLAALRELFERCQQDGRISFDYDTRIITGTLQL